MWCIMHMHGYMAWKHNKMWRYVHLAAFICTTLRRLHPHSLFRSMSILLSISRPNQHVYDPLALLNGRGRSCPDWGIYNRYTDISLLDLEEVAWHFLRNVRRYSMGAPSTSTCNCILNLRLSPLWNPRCIRPPLLITLVFGCICSVMRCNAPTYLLPTLHLSLLLLQEIQYESWKYGFTIHCTFLPIEK